eukprot:scaffold52988_cov68-Phaeocystis_antarctica.AAC.18
MITQSATRPRVTLRPRVTQPHPSPLVASRLSPSGGGTHGLPRCGLYSQVAPRITQAGGTGAAALTPYATIPWATRAWPAQAPRGRAPRARGRRGSALLGQQVAKKAKGVALLT